METVDIGDEINMQAFLGKWFESFAGHLGAEIGTTDTNVDDVLDGLACITFPLAGTDFVRESRHLVEDVMDVLDDILSIDDELRVFRSAEGGMEDGAVFRLVDVDAVEHVFDGVLQAGFLSKLQEEGDRLVINAVLGIVEIQIILEFNDITRGALWILREDVLQLGIFDFVVMGLQGFPCRELCDVFHAFLFPNVKWLTAHVGNMEIIRNQYLPSSVVAFFAEGRFVDGTKLPMDGVLLGPKETGGPFSSGERKRRGIFRDGDDAREMDDDASVLQFFDLVNDAIHAGAALDGLQTLDVGLLGRIAAAERNAICEGEFKVVHINEFRRRIPLAFVKITEEFFRGRLHGAFMSQSRVFASGEQQQTCTCGECHAPFFQHISSPVLSLFPVP